MTGGAGFIGSNLVENLLANGDEVTVLDNLSTGRLENIHSKSVRVEKFDLVDGDENSLLEHLKGVDVVYHLSANADVRWGWNHPLRDLEQNTLATARIAEAARKAEVADFVFTSTGSVYGEALSFPTPESECLSAQTSLYGASKISAENFLQAYSENNSFRVTVFRLVSVLGPHYSHGHVVDFVAQLREHPEFLTVLGNGQQKKSYIHVADVVSALRLVRASGRFESFNLGTREVITVRESAAIIADTMNLSPEFRFGEEDRGWVGDNPVIFLDSAKAEAVGWTCAKTIEESIIETVMWLLR